MADKSDTLPTALKVSDGKPGKPTETSLLRRKTVIIGRDVECDIVVKDAKASRQHCRLTRGDGAFILEDLKSKNGTFVDGQRVEGKVTLKANQAFKIGDTVFYLSR